MRNKIVPKDSDFDKAVDALGFYMTELLTAQQLNDLKNLYASQSAQQQGVSVAAGNYYFNTETSRAIEKIISPALQMHFSNFNYFVGAFSIFKARETSSLSLSRDWNLTDEKTDAVLNIWIPFEISYPQNGGAVFVPGSHQFNTSYRSGSFGSDSLAASATIQPFVTDVIIPPLSALCYEGSLLHGHYPNQTDKEQAGVLINLVPQNVHTYYFHLNNGTAKKYSINAQQFIESLPELLEGKRPAKSDSVERIPLIAEKQTEISYTSLLEDIRKKFGGDEECFHSNQLHLLKDVEIRKQMYERGYAILDFVDDATVSTLKEKYLSRFKKPVTDTGRFTTMENTSPETRLEIHNYVLETIAGSLNRYFADYSIPIASYFTKYARSKGDLEWHTDASLLLNAHLEPHYAIWCPLIEVDAQNGALCVVDGTHKFPHRIFLNGVGWAYQSMVEEFEKSGKVIPLKPGQAVLFDIRLVHNATPNISDQDRICFSLRMTHRKTRYYHFEVGYSNDNSIKVYNENQDIYLREVWNTPLMVPKEVDFVGEISN